MSGSPPAPSFHAHWLMSIGSLEPPPVKIVLFRLSSADHETAVAPLVFAAFTHWFGIELVVSLVIVTS